LLKIDGENVATLNNDELRAASICVIPPMSKQAKEV
jgi:hypothetical protein